MYKKNKWSFSGDVVSVFDEHVKKSVPMYDSFHEHIVNIVPYFLQKNTKIVDIGTSTGVLINKIKNSIDRGNRFIGIDIERDMIEECSKRYVGIDFICEEASSFDFSDSSVVICMLSLQFMSEDDRVALLKKVYKELRNGGALFIVEKIRTNHCEIHDIYNDLYYDFKRTSFSAEDVLSKNASLRGIMKPLTIQRNLEALERSGFVENDIFLKTMNFVGIVSIKTEGVV